MKYLLAILLTLSAFAQTAVFPGGVAGDSQLGVAANGVQMGLVASIDSFATSVTLNSTTGLVANMIMSLDNEEVWVCSVNSGTGVVTLGKSACPNIDGRGVDNTAAASHNRGTTVSAFVDRWHHEAIKAEVVAIETASRSAFVYDTAFATAALACASTKTVAVTNAAMWAGLSTMTCAAPLWFPGTGVTITPLAGQSISLTGSITAPANLQIFNTLASGATISLSSGCCRELSPSWWGVLTDWNGSSGTDNSATMLSAVLTAGTSHIPLKLPCGNMFMASSLTLTLPVNLDIGGCQTNDVGGILTGSWFVFGSGAGMIFNSADYTTLHDFGVQVLAGGLDAVLLQNNISHMNLRRMTFLNANPAKSLIEAAPGVSGDLDQINLEENYYLPATSYSVPPIYFHGGVMTPIRIVGNHSRQWTGSATASAPFLKVDCGTGNGCNNFVLENILSEVTPAGLIEMDTVTDVTYINVVEADSGSNTKPMVYLNAGGGAGQIIGSHTFVNCLFFDGNANNTSPSVLINLVGNFSQPKVSYLNGNISYTRILGNSNGATVVATNTITKDLYDLTSISGIVQVGNAALTEASGASLGLNTSNITGRATYMNSAGLHSRLANCLRNTDLAVDATDSHKITSANWTPNTNDIGSYVWVYAGTGFDIGVPLQIINVVGGAAILQTEAGTVGSTAGTFTVGRGLLGVDWVLQSPIAAADVLPVCSGNSGGTLSMKTLQQIIPDTLFANLPSGALIGTQANITDSTTNTWGANVTGGGAFRIVGLWNGANWTVLGK